MSNLLDNAVKYTPEGGRIGGASLTREGTEWVEFFIRDTGMGIPAEEQSRLFERFYRVDKARSRELGGTGLGLAIVKHLVHAHGGEVRVESDVGRAPHFSSRSRGTRQNQEAAQDSRPDSLRLNPAVTQSRLR